MLQNKIKKPSKWFLSSISEQNYGCKVHLFSPCIAKNLSMKLPSLEKNSGLGVAFSFSASLAAFGFFIHEGNPAFFTTLQNWLSEVKNSNEDLQMNLTYFSFWTHEHVQENVCCNYSDILTKAYCFGIEYMYF